jgi:hypothetical protein
VTQMGGHGTFNDARIGIDIRQEPDLVTPKLFALLRYQLSLQTPPPPRGSFDEEAAQRGKKLFNGVARCATCHEPSEFGMNAPANASELRTSRASREFSTIGYERLHNPALKAVERSAFIKRKLAEHHY